MRTYQRKMAGAIALIAGALMFGALPAGATVVGGDVTQGTGSFHRLDSSTGFEVGHNNWQNRNLYAFEGVQNYTLTAGLDVDLGAAPVAGDIVASHFVFYDPKGSKTIRQKGWVDFDSAIYGVIWGHDNLLASDFLQASAVTYHTGSQYYGIETGTDSVSIGDTLSGIDGGRLYVNWKAGNPGDYVRVLTKFSPSAVPLPAAGWLLIGGLGCLFGLGRKRRAA